jgi:hypothetical protein
VVHRLEMVKDRQALVSHEESLRQQLKLKSLGLSSLQRTMARQESCVIWLSEGDAPTRFFHAHANGHRRKNHIHSLIHEGWALLAEDSKVEVALNYFNDVFGTSAVRSNSINFEHLDLPHLAMPELSDRFTKDEVWLVIRSLPPDKAPGVDDFTVHNYVQNSNRRGDHIHIRDEPLNERLISSKMRRARISEERNWLSGG